MDDGHYFKFSYKCYLFPAAPIEPTVVKYVNGKLSGEQDGEVVFERENPDMALFWQKLSDIGVWEWEGYYNRNSPGLTYIWELEMDDGDMKNMFSVGINTSPPGVRIEESVDFKRFLDVVDELVGEHDLFWELLGIYED